MHRLLVFFLIIIPFYNASASRSVQKKVTINAELALNTCALSLSPADLNFQQVSVNQLENSATTPQTVDLNIACSWPATGISLKFSPAAGVSASSTNLMKTGLSGVGLALSWKDVAGTDFKPLELNNSFSPASTALNNKSEMLGQFQLLPKQIPGETLQAGNISTSLTVEVTYD
ncbi:MULTISPECIES: fimbrial protein [unclassified Enterobacter cloacae complex]|uniref:fimbrial protein n=1 Tax=unclassified Enterobacter cloacae complex TaxID=2757714 RepID=UPI00187284D1|nr:MULTISPECIES: fimbrial protein [unclassified Enterobacter cloacae complex]MBE4812113.1 fimbrial protein [Enterobacter cloacae complex sp. P44RS]MBE4829360.1 fimbrial protein [Enterobacter cloacae complex sp. P42RS]MBE4838430.1 fimbrial protein [Enterobacter cloacae complex sp. P46RS]MBE4842644.1 fimbrial protein [Enterobacter cloacae complex sp. P42C]